MEGGANVHSIDAVRDFRAALVRFAHEAKEALSSHDIELRRSLDWLLDAEPEFWKKEIRRCEDAETQAKIELERRLNSRLPGGEAPSCMEERKLLERARNRRRRAEETCAAMRRYAHAAQHEAEEYGTRARQLGDALEVDLPKAIATLDRALTALESYVALGGGGGSSRRGQSRPTMARGHQQPDEPSHDELNESPADEPDDRTDEAQP